MWRNDLLQSRSEASSFVNGGKAMAADNTSRAAVLRTMLFFGMVIYFGYSLAFQNTEELSNIRLLRRLMQAVHHIK